MIVALPGLFSYLFLDKANYSYIFDGCVICYGTARVYDVYICIINKSYGKICYAFEIDL